MTSLGTLDRPSDAAEVFDEEIEFYIDSFLKLTAAEDKWNFVALQILTTGYTVNLGTSRLVNYAHKGNVAAQ